MSADGPWITFHSNGEEYGLDVHSVVEILSPREVTPLPGARPHVAGIVSWRGRTIPVLDLPWCLKAVPPTPEWRKGMFVLRGREPFALRVDTPGRIIGGPGYEEESSSGSPPGDTPPADAGGVRWEGGFVRILDPRNILGDDPLVVQDVPGPGERA